MAPMMCPSCFAAEINPRTGHFHADCQECSIRALSQSPAHHAARLAGKMIPGYTEELARLAGDDPQAQIALHFRVKAWCQRIEAAA